MSAEHAHHAAPEARKPKHEGRVERKKSVERSTGHNTEVCLSFTRHSQKSSGAVASKDGAISAAGISPGGIERAKVFGKKHYKGRDIKKGYVTSVSRTNETFGAALEGAGLKDEFATLEEGKKDSFFAFPGAYQWSKEFMGEYNKVMAPHKASLLKSKHGGAEMDSLTPDEQEKIAEVAEEPAMDWWLKFGKTKPHDFYKGKQNSDGTPVLSETDTTPSPYEIASMVGFKVNRLLNLTDRMPDGNRVDLLSVGHKTSTEAFLKYALILPGKKEAGFQSLKEIGGSLRPLDTWDLRVRNNVFGKKDVSITIRRENGKKTKYKMDTKALAELAEKGAEFLGQKTKKIDRPSSPTHAELNAIEAVRKKLADFFKPKAA